MFGSRNSLMGRLRLLTRGLEHGYQSTINSKKTLENSASSSNWGLAYSDGGYSPISLS